MALTHDLKYLIKQRCRNIYLALPRCRRNSTSLPNGPILSCNATFRPVLELLLKAECSMGGLHSIFHFKDLYLSF